MDLSEFQDVQDFRNPMNDNNNVSQAREHHFWDDWNLANTLQALEFEISNEMIEGHHEEEGDFNEKEYRASKSCRRQLLTMSAFICLVQIVLFICMVSYGGFTPRTVNPTIGPPV